VCLHSITWKDDSVCAEIYVNVVWSQKLVLPAALLCKSEICLVVHMGFSSRQSRVELDGSWRGSLYSTMGGGLSSPSKSSADPKLDAVFSMRVYTLFSVMVLAALLIKSAEMFVCEVTYFLMDCSLVNN